MQTTLSSATASTPTVDRELTEQELATIHAGFIPVFVPFIPVFRVVFWPVVVFF
jgi:hypothetical protein